MTEREIYNRLTPEEQARLNRAREELKKAYKNPQEQADEVVAEHLLALLGQHNLDIRELRLGKIPKEEARERVKEINRTFNLYANKKADFYDSIRIRFFEVGDKFYFISMGIEDESVDVRRQGNV